MRELFAARLQSSTAYPFDRLEARWLAKLPGLLDDAETRRVRGGNQRIAAALAGGLAAPVALGTRARAVRHDADGVRVTTDRGDVTADACVVAVPCSLVPDLAFEPALPGTVHAALAAIPMSAAAKLAVPLRRAEAPRALMSAPARFWAWTTPCDEVGGRVAGSWAGATPVLEALEIRDGHPAGWLRQLRALWPELALDDDGALLTVWDRGSWARGAYSVQCTDEQAPLDAGHAARRLRRRAHRRRVVGDDGGRAPQRPARRARRARVPLSDTRSGTSNRRNGRASG